MQRWLVLLIACVVFARADWQRLLAAPLPPATFWGVLTINGAPAADGTLITALIGEIEYASTRTFSSAGETGLYVIDVPADDPNTVGVVEGGHEGETVTFHLAGSQLAGSAGWGGGTSNVTLSAQIPIAIEAEFTCSPLAGSPPLVVNCSDTSTGDITAWNWDFGDGAVSSLQNPSHTFRGGGMYSVGLTVSGGEGSDTAIRLAYVKVNFVEQIETIDPLPPYCVLRSGEHLYERVLEITGTGLSDAERHLQFRNDSTSDLSIHIGSEVTWESSTKAWVDFANIYHLLWLGAKVPLRVRLTEFSNNEYYPVSEWSAQFYLADSAIACGASRPEPNEAPLFMTIALTQALEDALYNYAITATDANAGDVLLISAPQLPNWLTLTDHGDGTAQLQGMPSNEHVGNADVTLRVTDAAGAWAEQSFVVAIANSNDAPEIKPQSFSLLENSAVGTFVGAVLTSDVDVGDALEVAIVTGNLEESFALDALTGELTVARSPDYEAGPVSHTLSVMVSDQGGLTATATVTIEIIDQVEPEASPVLFIPHVGYHERPANLR